MLLEIHVQAVRKKMSQMLVFRFQAVMRSEIKVAKVMMSHCQEKLLARTILPVPQTDTGSRVENTQVSERTLVKELGKMTRNFGRRGADSKISAAVNRPKQLFIKNTGICKIVR